MSSVASFQGLASGINFRDLVDQIIQAESRPVTLMKARTAEITRKSTAWGDVTARVRTLDARAADLADGTLFGAFRTSVTGWTGAAPVSVAAGSSASPGSFALAVQRLASAEKLSGGTVASRSTALGLTGEFLVGGRAVAVQAGDSLDDVAAALNAVNTGSLRSGASASVVAAAGGYRLVLTAAETGADGIELADGAGGVLRGLGLLDGTVALASPTSDGARSRGLASATLVVGSLLGLSTPPSGVVGIGALSVSVDLAADSLRDVADAVNAAALGAGSAITAEVETAEAADGSAVSRLRVRGTTSFTDAGGVLEALGVVERGRGAVAQRLEGVAFTDGGGVTAATSTTLLTDLWAGGASEGVAVGDTLTLSGRRGDGTAFTKTFAVQAGSTYGDLVDALNSASDAFGSGSRTAVVSLEGGRLVVTDGTAGDSRLALSVVAHNEGGGTLDFGDFSVAATGRVRQVTAGSDAELTLDGVFFTRSSNVVTDLVEGVTLTLAEASGEAVVVGVERDAAAIASGIEAFVKAFNAVAELVDSQFTGAGASDPAATRPLSGDAVARSIRLQLKAALEGAVSSAVTDLSRLSELGITLNRSGTYDIDAATLKAAIEADPLSVQRYFAEYGAGSTSALTYVGASADTTSGLHDVVVTTAPARAGATGAGFAGTYVDDGTADALTVTDAETGAAYTVSLANGMTLAEIVDSLNAEFATATARVTRSTEALKADAGGTAAAEATPLAALRDGSGASLGVAAGDTFTLSGTRPDGTGFFGDFVVADPLTQTLGDLRAELAALVGSEVGFTVEGGRLVATAAQAGSASFTVAVSSDNAGGGSFSLGGFEVSDPGRGVTGVRASASGGQLSLVHEDFGSAAGFDVSFSAGGADGTAALGLAPGIYRGVDVAGTVGGVAATGSGRHLTGAAGSAAAGLRVTYAGSSTGAVGSVRYSRGVASLMEAATGRLLGSEAGSLKSTVDALDTQKQGVEARIEAFEARLDRRAELLIKRFTALEEAMARAQQQMTWLQSQLGSLTSNPQR